MFDPFLHRWGLRRDGEPIVTPTARLLPVTRDDEPAMLKLSLDEGGDRGGGLLQWWDGKGAARVLARDGAALLMERAAGPASLADMARSGRDDEACRVLCAVAARLHAPRPGTPPGLVPLADWFARLEPAAAAQGGMLARCAAAARALLADPREVGVLHGDLHHGNVLDFGARGWLAIDPKGLIGERGFDFANVFTNPDLADLARPIATEPGRLARRVDVVARAGGLEPRRLLLWILAWSGLSAAWFLDDGDSRAGIGLRVAALAAAELDR
jgi:streptomycin 6-kinase